MNTRVLELIKNPKIIIESDLNLLESESEKMPYAQSLRALYLYGINLYKTENYKENLTKTAAYTTDKKILYQFINSQKTVLKEEFPTQEITKQPIDIQETKQEFVDENTIEEIVENPVDVEHQNVVLNKFDVDKIIETEDSHNSEFIVVEGEKNRLLYEGEENFLEEKSEEIDMEATKESGIITIKDDLEIKEKLILIDENRSEETIAEHLEVEEVLEIPEEKIIEAEAETQVQDEDSSGNISFNGIEEFLPQVKFSIPKNHLDYLNPPKKQAKKEADPIPEKPISNSNYKEPEVPEIDENEIDTNEISFENTQAFEVSKPEENVTETKQEEVQEQAISDWKPMSFSSNIPDSLIGKSPEIQTPKQEIKPEEKVVEPEIVEEIIVDEKPIVEEKTQPTETERPVMNVSFFGNEVSKIEEKEKEIPAILEKQETIETVDSNVGTFINTWQSWLKIDRPKSDDSPEKTIVVKEKIIDNFIETNPKISQLKEESNYIVKEKKDDISHLMTETLAKLYVEQKLYTKAIKAYEILSEKHPQKADYFNEKIEEVKEIRKS